MSNEMSNVIWKSLAWFKRNFPKKPKPSFKPSFTERPPQEYVKDSGTVIDSKEST
jgi:hypothetical protein